MILLLALALQTASPGPTAPKTAQLAIASVTVAPVTVASVKVTAKAEDPYEKVCRRDIRTGSRITVPVCYTREEWVLMERGAKEFMDRALHPTGCAPGSTC